MSRTAGRFDPAPLLRHLELVVEPRPGRFPDGFYPSLAFARPLDQDISEAAGVTRRTIQRWRHGGRLSSPQADRVATRLGLHPALLWDSWYTES